MIEIYDDFLTKSEFLDVLKYCKNSLYKYGEVDRSDTPSVGMVSEIFEDDIFLKEFDSRIRNKIKSIDKLSLYRSYINCFSPNDRPYFHTDNHQGVTCLYYANDDWNLDDGGETQFLIENEIKGILPIPNRLVCFDARLLHKATTFRTNYRFTIAIKYE